MQFKVCTESSNPVTDLDFTIAIPDAAAREYTTLCNAGIAAVLAKMGALLVEAEDQNDMSKFSADGQKVLQKLAE